TRAGAIVRPGGGWKMQRRPPPSADGAPSRADRRRLLLDRRRGAVRLGRFDPCIAGGRRCVHLARADDLAVRRLQVEVLLAVRRGLALVARVVAAVLLHRGNAVLRGRLRVVRLTPQDRLAVAGLEAEGELPLFFLAEHEPSAQESPLLRELPPPDSAAAARGLYYHGALRSKKPQPVPAHRVAWRGGDWGRDGRAIAGDAGAPAARSSRAW